MDEDLELRSTATNASKIAFPQGPAAKGCVQTTPPLGKRASSGRRKRESCDWCRVLQG